MSKPATRPELMQAIGMTISRWQEEVQAFDAAAADRIGVNPSDQTCLGHLARNGSMTPGQLAKAANLTPAAMTSAIDRLEAAGLAHRVRSKTDRRSIQVELTAAAQRLIGDLWGPIVADGNRLLDGYTTAELRLLAQFVEKCRELQARHVVRLADETRKRR